MLALKAINVKNDFKNVCSAVSAGTTVVISRPKNQNVVMLSEKRYNELEYLEKLALARRQVADGNTVAKAFSELEVME